MASPLVGIIMGSASDDPTMQKGAAILDQLGIAYEVTVSSAHRNPDATAEYARTAADRGLKVVIAGAGLAAALPGVIAAHTTLPVIGVPVASGALNGVDALYAIVQMPPGVPVATVGIDNARNAAVLAAQILALTDDNIQARLVEYKKGLAGK
jgi:5-(carboxyamino)imidazole ribonucleotide mutase